MYRRLVQYKEENGDCLVPRKYEEDPKLATWVETQRNLWNRDYRGGRQSVTVTGDHDNNHHHDDDNNAENNTMEMDDQPPLSPFDNNDGRMEGLDESHHDGPSPAEVHDGTMSEPAPSPDQRPYLPSHHDDSQDDDDAGNEDHEVEPFEYQPEPDGTDPHLPATSPERTAEQGAPVDVRDDGYCDALTGTAATTCPAEEDTTWKRLTAERKQKLDRIGFVWSLRTKRVDEHWDAMFEQLLRYRAEHGDCLVPSRYGANPKLGKWVETQRYEYTKLLRGPTGAGPTKGEAGCRPPPPLWDTATEPTTGEDPAPAAESDDVGGGFDGAFFTEATAGQAELADRPCTDSYVGSQPRGTSNARLTEDRRRRLESIGFEWKVRHRMKRYYDRQWDTMFEKLKAFKEVNGHCMVRIWRT
jgi:hypothetical protein